MVPQPDLTLKQAYELKDALHLSGTGLDKLAEVCLVLFEAVGDRAFDFISEEAQSVINSFTNAAVNNVAIVGQFMTQWGPQIKTAPEVHVAYFLSDVVKEFFTPQFSQIQSNPEIEQLLNHYYSLDILLEAYNIDAIEDRELVNQALSNILAERADLSVLACIYKLQVQFGNPAPACAAIDKVVDYLKANKPLAERWDAVLPVLTDISTNWLFEVIESLFSDAPDYLNTYYDALITVAEDDSDIIQKAVLAQNKLKRKIT
jgi:hypothetical protein